MNRLKNKIFAFMLSVMMFSLARGGIRRFMRSVSNFKSTWIDNKNYPWVWRWRNNPVEETSLYHLSDNQLSENSVFTLFSHGVATDPGAGTLYKIRNHLPINSDFYGFTYNDHRPLYFPLPSPQNTNFAQAADIECLKKAYGDSYYFICNNNQYDKIIVYGVSRGATTPLTILATIDNDENAKKFLEMVDAFILEAPFASMDDVTKNISTITKTICSPLSRIAKKTIGLSEDSAQNLMGKVFQDYDKNGISAWDAIDKIYKENGTTLKTLLTKPILLACTKKDLKVPVWSTVRLYYKLKEIGHQAVYIYIADTGIHGLMALSGNKYDYEAAVQAFYYKYGIPCNEKLVKKGLEILKKGADDAEKIMKEYINNRGII